MTIAIKRRTPPLLKETDLMRQNLSLFLPFLFRTASDSLTSSPCLNCELRSRNLRPKFKLRCPCVQSFSVFSSNKWLVELWTFPHYKHCQRHNEPKDWVLLTKFIYFSHITRANTKTDQILSSSYWPNLLQILPELQLQNNDQTLCSKSEQKFNFMTKPPLPYLQQAVANTILIINISNNKNLNKFWVGIFKGQSHINQVY